MSLVLVDPRRGSGELDALLRATGFSQVRLEELEFGDFCFPGQGPAGDCSIGIERKRLHDLLSSMRNKRFSGHQLPGLLSAYDYPFLFVEGHFQSGPTGLLEEPRRGGWRPVSHNGNFYHYQEVLNFLTTLELHTHLRIRYPSNPRDTCTQLLTLHTYFNSKPWDDHKSHLAFYHPPPTRVEIFRPSFLRRVAKEHDGVGWEKSKAIESHFHTPRAMALATVREWKLVEGVGDTLATSIVNEWNGGKGRR